MPSGNMTEVYMHIHHPYSIVHPIPTARLHSSWNHVVVIAALLLMLHCCCWSTVTVTSCIWVLVTDCHWMLRACQHSLSCTLKPLTHAVLQNTCLVSVVTDMQQLYQIRMPNSHNRCMWMHASQVGSILFTAEAGQMYAKGDELGYFAFGGSTCIAVFQKDCVVVDEDIITNRSACPKAAH